MAQRRMFSIKLIDSAKFLKMPASTRLLYYDLGMRADDDGIVEAFNTLRMTGATEDDLRILVAKGYIQVLNEDLVTYILDWKEHNKIRADRKVNSLYKDLLLQIMPEVELTIPKPRADRPKRTKDVFGTSQGQPTDSIGQDRIGQDRTGKDRTEQGNVSKAIEEFLNVSSKEAAVIVDACRKYRSNKDVVVVVKEKWKVISNGNFKNPIGALVQAIKDDWKQSENNKKEIRFNSFENQRDTDFDKLEKKLLGWDDDDE